MYEKYRIIDRDGCYSKYENGVVYDSKTGLEWIAGPRGRKSWYEANEWVKGLEIDGSGWRMPTSKELETIYQDGMGNRNMTRLLKTKAWWVWSAEQDNNLSLSLFDFSRGTRDWHSRTPRAYAMRARKSWTIHFIDSCCGKLVLHSEGHLCSYEPCLYLIMQSNDSTWKCRH